MSDSGSVDVKNVERGGGEGFCAPRACPSPTSISIIAKMNPSTALRVNMGKIIVYRTCFLDW